MLDKDLSIACKENNIKEIDSKLKNGANINDFDDNGYTPLHISIKYRKNETMEFLINNGANINIRCEYNYSPIQLACMFNNIDAVIILLKNNVNMKDNELLHISCTYGYIKIVKLLISFKCDLDEIDSYGRTPAFWAIQESKIDCLQELYKSGADFNKRDQKGSTLLSYAVGEGNLKIVRYLLEIGLDKYIDDNKYPPIILATHWNYIEIVKLLIEKGANVNIKNNLGDTALIDAVQNANYCIAKILIENKAKLQIRKKDGVTLIELLNTQYKDIEEILYIIENLEKT